MHNLGANAPITGLGAGLRGPHVPDILREHPPINWFELLTDNHLVDGGAHRFQAEAVATQYPISLHGVGLSLGGVDALDLDYLGQVRDLARRTHPHFISEHLAFTACGNVHSHDLLPLPWTEEALDHVAVRVSEVQDFLGQRLLVENISTYLEYQHSTLTEAEFLEELCARADCGVLLDINNIYVNAINHGQDPQSMLDALPLERACEIHLAGHEKRGDLLIDSHVGHVSDPVLSLFTHALARIPDVPVLFEWDTQLPAWEVVHQEVMRLDQVRNEALA